MNRLGGAAFRLPRHIYPTKHGGFLDVRLQLTRQECKWLADLANKARVEAGLENKTTPHPLWELRRDNMASLEKQINAAIKREIERNDAR